MRPTRSQPSRLTMFPAQGKSCDSLSRRSSTGPVGDSEANGSRLLHPLSAKAQPDRAPGAAVRSGNPIASAAVCAGPEWDDLYAVTRVACQWPARVTKARFWPDTDGLLLRVGSEPGQRTGRTSSRLRPARKTTHCCPVAWPTGVPHGATA